MACKLTNATIGVMWLSDANVALPAYNVTEPRYPLRTNYESSRFKLFSSDVGILTYQCGMDVVRDLLAERAVVLHEGNVKQSGQVLYLPAYMAMCLKPGF